MRQGPLWNGFIHFGQYAVAHLSHVLFGYFVFTMPLQFGCVHYLRCGLADRYPYLSLFLTFSTTFPGNTFQMAGSFTNSFLHPFSGHSTSTNISDLVVIWVTQQSRQNRWLQAEIGYSRGFVSQHIGHYIGKGVILLFLVKGLMYIYYFCGSSKDLWWILTRIRIDYYAYQSRDSRLRYPVNPSFLNVGIIEHAKAWAS